MNEELEKSRQEPDDAGDKLESNLDSLLKLVPEDKKEQASAIVAVVKESMVAFSGPIPPPEQFEQYETILPGSADRILKMAEKQQDHRIEIEKEAISKSLRFNHRGQSFGFFAMLLMIALSVFFALFGMEVWAGTIGSVTIVTLVALFLTGNAQNSKELKSKK